MLCRVPRVTNENVLVGFDKADDAGVYKLTPELAPKEDKIHMLELLLNQRQPAAPAGGGGGGGGKKPDEAAVCATYIVSLKNAEQEVQRLRAAEAARGSGSSLPGPAVDEVALRNRATEEFVAVLIREGDDPKKTPCARRPLYQLAIETINKSNPPDAKNKIDDLVKKIRKISD